MVQGFFDIFLSRVANQVNEHFKPGDIIEVKAVRRITETRSSDRSNIIFFARALQKLSDLGFLKLLERTNSNAPKKFKILSKINIEDQHE